MSEPKRPAELENLDLCDCEQVILDWTGEADDYMDHLEARIAELEAERDRECVWRKEWQLTSNTAAPDPIWRTQCKHVSTKPPLLRCPYCGGKIEEATDG